MRAWVTWALWSRLNLFMTCHLNQVHLLRGCLPTPTLPLRRRWHQLLASPSLLTPKMIFMHVELEEHTGCANAHYLRKSVVYNNNNASSVFYPPRIFTISMCTFDFSCTMTMSYLPLCLILKSPNIGRDAYSFSMQWYHCYFFNTRSFNFATLCYWRAQKLINFQ